jgi:hypothetical protein
LAATAVEKYLKCLLAGLAKRYDRIHLNKLHELKKQFEKSDFEELFTTYFDDVFLNILGSAYRFRYLDRNTEIVQFGFLTRQFLAELDYTVNLIERLITIKDNGVQISHLFGDIANNRRELMENNFLALGIPKEGFMNLPSTGYGLFYDSNTSSPIEITRLESKPEVLYMGNILKIEVNR